MKPVIGILLLADLYLLVYYRLLVKFYYEKASGTTESAFGALFSVPPYKILPERGRKYARRYWGAVTILVFCVGVLFVLADFRFPG